jgi:hypothetical protein
VARPPAHHLAFPSPSLSPKILAAPSFSFIYSSFPCFLLGWYPDGVPTILTTSSSFIGSSFPCPGWAYSRSG